NPEKRLEVVVYVDGEPVAEGVADLYREDLERAGIGDGRHGFRIKLDEKIFKGSNNTISVRVKFYEIELLRSMRYFKNADLNKRHTQMSMTNEISYPIRGYIDKIEGLFIHGWAYNPLVPNEKVVLWVYIDEQLVGIIQADLYREDLKQVGIGDGNHGFIFKISEDFLDSKPHIVRVKAYNVYDLNNSPIKVNFLEKKIENFNYIPKYIENDHYEGVYIPFKVQYQLFNSENHFSLYENTDFVKSIINDIDELVNKKNIKLISIDIFDTILLRNNKCELRRFYEISQRFADLLKIDFIEIFLLRIMIHKETYRYFAKGLDNTIEGDYINQLEILCKVLDRKKYLNELLEIEINYEIENTLMNPFFMKILDYVKSKNLNIIATSDMYFSSEIIKRILDYHSKIHQLNLNNLSIYSSASHLLSKRMGGIFDIIKKDYKISNSYEILHIGDDYYSDYIKPKEKNITTYLLPLPEKIKYERFKDFKDLINELMEQIPLEIIHEYILFNL
ncbi:MAG: hypothetical protein QXS69_02065, partial [Candidatus Aenigmatarchaeota archaeon]